MNRLTLIDVGARGGICSRWAPFESYMNVYGFEPDPQECAQLNASGSKITYLPAALGERDGEAATLYITKQPGCSSLLKPEHEYLKQFPYGPNLEVVRTYPMTVSRLETVCDERGIRPHAMKIDTQGTELSILKGCGKALDSMLAVELEVEFQPMYQGQPLFGEIDAFMRSQGFTLRGLRRTYWRQNAKPSHAHGGQLMHGDALYLRVDKIDNAIGHMILAAYRQYDLLAKFGAHHLIPKPSGLSRLAGRFLARYWNGTDLRRIVDGLRPAHATDWHDPDFF